MNRISTGPTHAIPTLALLSAATFLPACETATSVSTSGSGFGPATSWSEPIMDYLAVGEANFPDGFTREITALDAFDPDGRGPQPELLWIGYGDATRNMGSKTPVEFRYFISPEDPGYRVARVLAAPPVTPTQQGERQRTPFDTGEEQIEPYRVVDGVLWQAGVDSTDADELWTQAKPAEHRPIEGNVFRLDDRHGQPAWRKFRTIPGGEHVHDICAYDGSIWAVGSGSAHRTEWESGEIFRYLWRSDDGGETFEPTLRVMFPEKGKGDTRFRRLLPVGDSLYVFGYVNPFVDGGPIEGRHVRLRDGMVGDVEGEIADLLVLRTWPLDGETGLALARDPDRTTRMFVVEAEGVRELDAWSDLAVVDVAPVGSAASSGEFLLVAGDRAEEPAHAVFAFSVEDVRANRPPREILDLPEVAPSAIAVWGGDLFIGTREGAVLRARSERP